MDEIKNGVIETTGLPDNVEQLVEVNIKDGKATATLYANQNGSKVKQSLDNLKYKFENLKTITVNGDKKDLYGPGNIEINTTSGGGDLSGATKTYVDTQDEAVKSYAKTLADQALADAKNYFNSVIISDNGSVVTIDATADATTAKLACDDAISNNKSVVLKCAKSVYTPVTTIVSNTGEVSYKGTAMTYGGYELLTGVTLETSEYTLGSAGLTKVSKEVPINSCRIFDCTNASMNVNIFQYAVSAYNDGLAVILKVGKNRYVLANNASASYLRGYAFDFVVGTVSGAQQTVSVDIIRYTLSSGGLTQDSFNLGSGGDGGGGSTITIRNAFSTNDVSDGELPDSPDDNPSWWNQEVQTKSSVWGASKSTGNEWYFWRISAKQQSEPNGIRKIEIDYGTSKTSSAKPSTWYDVQPTVAEGEYLWTRVTIYYTVNTDTDVFYTVSKIGKDGIDGKAGTAITIKGTLESTDDLPTTGNTAGDGYIINGDLWVYTGTSGSSSTLINGFKNVGQIQGPSGKVPCLHQAWCNGDPFNGDYDDFTITALDGSKYIYSGTYIDYKDSAEDCKNCEDKLDPTIYKWTRTGGYDGDNTVSADLTSNQGTVPVTNSGKTKTAIALTTYIGMFEGKTPISITGIKVSSCPTGWEDNISTSITGGKDSNYPGMLSVTFKADDDCIEPSVNNAIEIEVTGVCLNQKDTHICKLTYNVIAAVDGDPALQYSITTDHNSIKYDKKKGTYDYNTVTATVYKAVGSESPVATSEGYLYYRKDGGAYTKISNNYAVTVSPATSKIEFLFMLVDGIDDTSDKYRLYADIPILSDGTDGDEGVGISDIKIDYAVNDSYTNRPAESEFSDIQPSESEVTGRFLWTRYKLIYTGTAGTYTWYSVNRIGKDGIDGAKGTAITIKGTLDETSKLPTSPTPSQGDGYIIDGDLWVYVGIENQDSTMINGFKNVGKIQGTDGKVACIHKAWCNGYPNDEFGHNELIDFDIDALVTKKYLFMGLYIDYKDSVDTVCPDSTDWQMYKWSRIGNISRVIADLDNEYDSVRLSNDDKLEVVKDYAFGINVKMTEEGEPIEITGIAVGKKPEGVTVTVGSYTDGERKDDGYPAHIDVVVPKGLTTIGEGTDGNSIELNITGKCATGDLSDAQLLTYKLNGYKDGKDAADYHMVTDPMSIEILEDGSYSCSEVKCYVNKETTEEVYLADNGYLYYRIDGGELKSMANGGSVSTENVGVKIDFYYHYSTEYNASLTNYYWTESATVLVSPKDGEDGDTPTIQKTEYKYALSMSYTTQYDSLYWSSDAIESAEPGQYIFVDTIRYWGIDGSDESTWKVTHDYSWTRYGLNGYSNLPYVSTVFMYSSSNPGSPTGGSYDSPVPSGWEDGVPENGVGKLWFSQRKFTMDGLDPQDAFWSIPVEATSSSTLNIMYSAQEECPKDPDTAVDGVWSATPSSDAIWGAYQKIDIIKDIKYTWVLYKIKGEGPMIDTTTAATPFMGEWDESTTYYGTKTRTDIVRVTGTQSGDTQGTYYYIANKAKNFESTTPKPGTTAGGEYWLKFGANYDSVATGILFGEKVIADMFTAINANIDKLNVGDLVAKKVRTAEDGVRILIENNQFKSYDSNNKIVAEIDPSVTITDTLDEEDNKVVVNNSVLTLVSDGTFYSTGTSTQTIDNTETSIATFTLVDDSYKHTFNLTKCLMDISFSGSARPTLLPMIRYSIKSSMKILKDGAVIKTIAPNYSLEVPATTYTDHNGIDLTGFYTAVDKVELSGVGKYEVLLYVTITTTTLRDSDTSITRKGALTIPANGVCAVFGMDRGVLIGDNGISIGEMNSEIHCIIGKTFSEAEDAGILDIQQGNAGIKIRQGKIKVTDFLGERELYAPVILSTSYSNLTSGSYTEEITEDEYNTAYRAFMNGIPVYVMAYISPDDTSGDSKPSYCKVEITQYLYNEDRLNGRLLVNTDNTGAYGMYAIAVWVGYNSVDTKYYIGVSANAIS